MAATTLGGLDSVSGLLPASYAKQIITKATEQSVVSTLAQQTPVQLRGTDAIAVQSGYINAGVVAEGAAKPVGNTDYQVKFIKPIKVASIAIVSKELARLNPAGVYDNIQQDLTNAIQRSLDLAVLHGLDAKTGAAITGANPAVAATTNSVELGTSAVAAGGLAQDLITGYNEVVGGDGVFTNFNGFAADPRFRGQLMGAVDTQGRPIFQQSVNLAQPVDSVLGLPTAYGRAVSGQIGASTDKNVRAIGGDWSALRYGFAEEITLSTSTEATIVDGGTTYNLFQQNMVAILAEAIFGWVVLDENAFVKYTVAAPES